MNKSVSGKSELKGMAGLTNVKSFRGKSFQSRGGRRTQQGRDNARGRKPSDKPKDFTGFISTAAKAEEGKTDWNQLKDRMKGLREQRKKNKRQTNYESYKEAKKLWEKLRNHGTSAEEKESICEDLMKMMKGNIKGMVRSHDTGRVVQWLVRLGSEKLREQIYSELSEDLVAMAKNKYTRHAVRSLLTHSNKTKRGVIQACSGGVYGLVTNRLSAPLVEEMYKVASQGERTVMLANMTKEMGMQDGNQELDEVSAALLSRGGKLMATLIEKDHSLSLALVHSLIKDYLDKCEASSKEELLASLRSRFKLLLSSKDGVKIFSMILWSSTSKEKKQIVKELKGELVELSSGESSCLGLMHVVDAVDDTVLVRNCLASEIANNAETLATNRHARKLLIYLMVHRDPVYFHPCDIEHLASLDSSPNSKKRSLQKIKEIQVDLLKPLASKISAAPSFWFQNSSVSMVTLSILKTLKGDLRSETYSSIANFVIDSDSTITENGKSYPAIEHAGVHLVLKKLIAEEKNLDNEDETLSKAISDLIDSEVALRLVKSNRGCFTLASILESDLPTVVPALRQSLAPLASQLKKETSAGCKVLRQLIKK